MENNFTTEEISFLNKLLSTVSPSGFEVECAEVIYTFLQGSCNLDYDVIGNLYAYSGDQIPKNGIMLTSHIDEVGFQVTRITDNGMVYVRRLGGLDRQSMPGTKLMVAGKSRNLIGVFGKTSPHIQKESEKAQVIEQDNLWVDFGFRNKVEAHLHINIGDFIGVAPNAQFTIDNRSIISKGLDNKISAFILAVTIKRITSYSYFPQDITFVFTVQEEIGCRGAIVATNRLNPHEAICLDVGIATDIPSMNAQTSLSDFMLHGGPGLCIAPDNNLQFVRRLEKLAVDYDITHQLSTGFRPAGGTETSKIQIEGEGVSTAHICIPNRYMHSAVEMCSMDDAFNTVRLLMSYISNM